jgi:hypothetical protein
MFIFISLEEETTDAVVDDIEDGGLSDGCLHDHNN